MVMRHEGGSAAASVWRLRRLAPSAIRVLVAQMQDTRLRLDRLDPPGVPPRLEPPGLRLLPRERV